MTADIILGDCVDVMAAMRAESIDAIVCDPPYGLEFMGKDWDAPWESDSHVGKRMQDGWSAVEMRDGGDRLRRPSFEKRSNVRCRTCNRWRLSSNPCKCDRPDFPDLRIANMREFQRWSEVWAREALRVLKPGAHLLAFGGTRTYHRMVCAIEDAGFEIRDCLSWLYGSGFPKSLDVSKALDAMAGADRQLTRDDTVTREGYGGDWDTGSSSTRPRYDEPATELAREWAGWGTALKPAWEPCVVARKPLAGTVAANVARYGTGAINVDACRIAGDVPQVTQGGNRASGFGMSERESEPHANGRWPANVALDEEAAAILDAQSGATGAAAAASGTTLRGASESNSRNRYNGLAADRDPAFYGDTGGASRFFYTAKASRSEREAYGRLKLEAQRRVDGPRADDAPGSNNPRLRTSARVNDHPTVKPLDLMEWLIKLVTPPGGIVLDPFAGSGSTLVAARRIRVRAIGIEKDPRSARIARQRIDAQWEVGLGI